MADYWSGDASNPKPIGYFGTIKEPNLYVNLNPISNALEQECRVIQAEQKGKAINGVQISSNNTELGTTFVNVVNKIVHAHTRMGSSDTSQTSTKDPPTATLIVPVFALNPRRHNDGKYGFSCGTLYGWLYFLYSLPNGTNKPGESVNKELIEILLPLLDDFAREVLAGDAEELIETRYRNENIKAQPIQFLKDNINFISGWELEICNEAAQTTEPFQWSDQSLIVSLGGNPREGFNLWVELKPSNTTLIPPTANVLERQRLGYHVAYHVRSIFKEIQYIHDVARIDELVKHKQMLDLLQKPLRAISNALSTMQSESQELRAILFEPEEALFSSHAAITPFFKEGFPFPLDAHWAKDRDLIVKHTPSQYKEEDAKLLLACLLCAIFGELDRIKSLPHRDLVLKEAAELIGGKAKRPETEVFAKDLAWLVAEDEDACLCEFLRNADRGKLSNAILRIKEALFSPFKAMSTQWHPLAFQLLVRNQSIFDKCILTDLVENSKTNRINLPESPVTYASVLAFLRDITLALRKPDAYGNATRVPSQFSISRESKEKGITHWILRLTFSNNIPDSEDGLDKKFFRKNLWMMAKRSPREWRIENDHYGDSTRPFVFLINKILGLGESTEYGWKVLKAENDDFFFCEKAVVESKGLQAKFAIGLEDNKSIYLKWIRENDEDIPM